MIATEAPSITLLGPDIEHRDSLAEMLEAGANRVDWLPDSISFLRGRNLRSRGPLARVVEQFGGTTHQEYLSYIDETLDASKAQVLIAYWGTIPLGDLVAIKKRRPCLKIVLMILCYPLAVSRIGIVRQNIYMNNALKFVDGVIFPTTEMEAYFRDRFFRRRSPQSVVVSPCWPVAFQSEKRPEAIGDIPNLIYTGRTDLSGKTIHPGDDIRMLMQEILDSGIELHHVYSPETNDEQPRRRTFRPLPLLKLIEFMGRFDASLVAYNTSACPRDDRFQFTVPDRLITSVCAGVPVAIPKQGYAGAKSYLKDYPAVIEFESPSFLAKALADRDRITKLKDEAWGARHRYNSKRHGPVLTAFLQRIF
jgi:hypothetical protein